MVWRFIDQSKVFVYGVEAGVIYERMSRGEQFIIATTHAENQEDLLNLANSLGYSAKFDALDDKEFWQSAAFTRAP